MKITANLVKKNFFLFFLDKVFRLFLSLFVNLMVINHLGLELYGYYSYCLALIGLLLPLSSFGMDSFVVKEVVNTDDVGKVVCSAIWVRIIGSVLGFFTALIIILNTNIGGFVFPLLMISVFFFDSLTVGRYVLLAYENGLLIASIDFFSFIVGLLAKIVFVLYDLPFYFLGAAYCIEFFACALLYLKFTPVCLEVFSFNRFDSDKLKTYFSVGKRLVVTGLLVAGLSKIDQLMLFHLLGSFEAGVYGMAFRFVEPFFIIGIIFSEAWLPYLLKIRNNLKDEYLKSIKVFSFFMIVGAVFLYMFLSVAFPMLMRLFFYENYAPVAEVYLFISLQLIVISLVILLDKILIVEGMFDINRFRVVVAFIVNLPLNFYAISNFGVVGAAMATISAYLIGIISLFLFKEFRVLTLSYMGRNY